MPPEPKRDSSCDPRQADWCAEKFNLLFAKLDQAAVERAANRKLLTGNGEVGFLERLRRIEEARLHDATEREKLRGSARRTFWTVIGGTVLLVVTYVFNLLVRLPR